MREAPPVYLHLARLSRRVIASPPKLLLALLPAPPPLLPDSEAPPPTPSRAVLEASGSVCEEAGGGREASPLGHLWS